MKTRQKLFNLLVIALLLLGVGVSCKPPATPTSVPATEEAEVEEVEETSDEMGPAVDRDTLVIGSTDAIRSITPWTVSTDLEYAVLNSMLYDRLIEYEDGSATPTMSSGLAESYEVSEDGLAWTFKLREGITFTDGEPVNAEAIKFSLEHTKQTGGPIVYYIDPYIKDVEVVDEYTVKVNLSFVYAPFDKIISLAIAGIYSPKAVQSMSDKDFQEKPVTSGPWIVESIVPSEECVLVRNENYWNKDRLPRIKRLIFRTIADPSALRLALEQGEIDMGFYYWLPADQIELEKDPRFTFTQQKNYYVSMLAIDGTRAPLDDPLVRQAIAYAIDRDRIIDTVYGGSARKMNSPLHTDMTIDGQSVVIEWPYEHDPDKAKELLAEAGYADGVPVDFWYTVGFGPEEPDVALLIQQDLAEVGIELNLQSSEFTALIEQWKDGATPFWSSRYVGGYLDPDPYLRDWYHSKSGFLGAKHGMDNPEIDRLLDTGANTTDPDVRLQSYEKIQQTVSQLALQIPMYVKPYDFIMKEQVVDFETPLVFWDMRYPFGTVHWTD